MRKVLILVVLAGALVSGVWLALGGGATATAPGGTEGTQRAAVAQVERGRGSGELQGFGRGEARARKLRERAAERAVMQRRINEQLARRAAARAEARDSVEAPNEAKAGRARAGEAVEDEAPAGQMVDRSGNREYLVKVMNEELIPLADECYAMAREKNPELGGMMAVDVELVGDEDVGGVVEEVKTSQVNEINDAGLLECVRESLMAVTLPPPAEGGRDGFMLSMRFAPDE